MEPTPDIPLLRKTWEKVSAIPSQHEAFAAYRRRTHGHVPGSWDQVFKTLGITEVWDQSSWGDTLSCGTAGCFAGWACMIADGRLSRDVEGRATELLGLTPEEVGHVFSGSNSRETLKEELAKVFERAGERFDG